jgi:hypothetical protein
MRGSGLMTNAMGKASLFGKINQRILGSGLITCNKEKVLKSGQMEQSMKASISTEKNTVTENLNEAMESHIKENSFTIK